MKTKPSSAHAFEPGAGSHLQPSSRHYKTSPQSWEWRWTNGGVLRCRGLALAPLEQPQAGMSGWVYSEKPIAGRLTFRLGTAENPAAYEFRFGLNFTGWRMLLIQFAVDAKSPDSAGGVIERLEIVPPTETGTVYLDDFEFLESASPHRSADYQIPEHPADRGASWQHWPLYYRRQAPLELLPATVTDQQRQDLETIDRRYRNWLLGESPDVSKPLLRRGAEQTQAYIKSGWEAFHALRLKVDAAGWITGPGLHLRKGANTFHHVFYNVLFPLVFDYKQNGNRAALDAALLVLDYVHDQGWADGSANGSLILNCLVFAPYCHTIALLRDELRESGRLEPAIRAAWWYLNFGKSFSRFDDGFIETNADELRSTMFTSLVMVLAMDESPRKIQYLRSWLAWLDNALEISPRFVGVFKPDGLGFHHEGVYAGAYATEAYEMAALMAYLLHGTGFAPAPAGLANLKAALRTQDVISQKYDVPFATMGRMPRAGVRIFSAYAYLALASEPPDAELAGIFMRLWEPESEYLNSTLSVDLDGVGGKFMCNQAPGRLQIMQELADRGLPAAPPPQGFWSKPWGALAVRRRDDWLVSVKGWSQYVWDFEMHPKLWAMVEENVYARYWSYGTLQVITHGDPKNPVASGWNLDKGWDWCRWPGATTPHLTLDELYDPQTTWASRFFSAATFVGGVSCEGRNGMFALKLHEHYDDPTFRAYKTYFFFDNEIICLGSNIESRDAAHAFGTTLFQSWMPEPGMPVEVNGNAVTSFPYEFRGTDGQPLTLRDPYGNGYYLPDGGAVRLTRVVQHSRDAWNRGATEGAFSTAWLDHGQPPKDDGYGAVRYHYVMLMQADAAALAACAESPPCRVLQQNHQAHIVEHTGQRTMAYALFETDWIIPHGLVRKTDTPVMIMVKQQDDQIVLSLADPDLRLPKRRNMGYLDAEANATPSRSATVRVELRGRWRMETPANASCISDQRTEVTVLQFTCVNGLTTEIALNRITG